MSASEYLKAQKLGEKRYQAAIAKKEYPYLPVLEELISASDIECEVNLGLQQIALGNVIGTATVGRTTAFASNFMPILDYKTEFGSKWSTLCDSHIEEGIHDPIKAYEYMNRFYVIEGNKRVSVLKYFGADSVPAMVIRKVPKRTNDPENRIYYEFMDFHKQTGINYIWFTKEGSFDKLRDYIGITADSTFSEDEKMDFNSAHLAFEKAFLARSGSEKLAINANDAMLIFLNVYGYEALKEMSQEEVKANLDKLWDEILLSNHKKDNQITPKLEPAESKKKLLAIKLAPKKLNVAFIYDKDPVNSVWIYSHELGRRDIEETFREQIDTQVFCNIDDNTKLADCLHQLAEEKYDIIFTTGPAMLQESLKAAIAYPDVKILNCSLNMSTSHVRTYYARMYEAKFITGIIAGSLCADGKIGYIADYPIYGTLANINAFALGAKLVNPRARVYLQWSKEKGTNPQEYFKNMDIHYISDQDMIAPQDISRQFGLYYSDENGISNLAMPFYNWALFYERIIKSVLDGNWKQDEKEVGTKALNYWWGMSAGLVDVICSKHLPVGTVRLVNLMKKLIIEGTVKPFYGKLYSQAGVVRENEEDEMKPEEIMKMDWLCENVVGNIPESSDLVEGAHDVVAIQGVNTPESLELKKSVES